MFSNEICGLASMAPLVEASSHKPKGQKVVGSIPQVRACAWVAGLVPHPGGVGEAPN